MLLKMLQAGSPGGNTTSPAFPALMHGVLIYSPPRNLASALRNSMCWFSGWGSAQVQPWQALCVAFAWPAAAMVGVVLSSASAKTWSSEECLFEVWSLGRRPQRTWAGHVWISKSKLKIYSSVWKIPGQNLHMDKKKYKFPCFFSVSSWRLEYHSEKEEIKVRPKSSVKGFRSDGFLAKSVRKVIC